MSEAPPTGPARAHPERSLAAALLNASALGAGYVYLRRWADVAIYWAGLVAWLLLASSTAFWLVAIVAWVGAAVVRAFLLGRRTAGPTASPSAPWAPPGQQVPGPGPGPDARGSGARGPDAGEREGGRGDARRAVPFVVALVLLVLVGTFVVSYRDGAYAALREGDELHADGRCADAVERFDDVASYDKSFTDALDQAPEHRAACRQLLTAREQAGDDDYEDAIAAYTAYAERGGDTALFRDGAWDELARVRARYAADLGHDGGSAARDWPEAYEQYLTIVNDHPGTPEAEAAPGEFRTLYRSATAEYADGQWCDAIDDLDVFADIGYRGAIYDPVASAAPSELRGAVTECGLGLLDDGDLDGAEPYLQRVVDEFPATQSARRAQRGLDRIAAERERRRIRGEIADAQPGATELPPPVPSGPSGSGRARLQITNGSTQPLEVLYDGPETGTIELPACGLCRDAGVDEVVTTCGIPTSPTVDVELPPGSYTVVARSTGDYVRPFSGTWPLSGGTLYSDCYFLQEVNLFDPAVVG